MEQDVGWRVKCEWERRKKSEEREGEHHSQGSLDRITGLSRGGKAGMVGIHIFIQGNGQLLHFWILIKIENSGYFLYTFACLLLLMETQNCSLYGYVSMGCITLSDVIFMRVCLESPFYRPHTVFYKDVNGKLMWLLANKKWLWQAVSESCCDVRLLLSTNMERQLLLNVSLMPRSVVQNTSSMSFFPPAFFLSILSSTQHMTRSKTDGGKELREK